MNYVQLTLAEDNRIALIRAELIEQVRQNRNGSEIWLPSHTVAVLESIERIAELLK
jgi:hypothetical protein